MEREEKQKNQDLQLLLDLLAQMDAGKQPYYFRITAGKYSKLSTDELVSHLDNQNATGMDEFLKHFAKLQNYDFDYIDVELFSKCKRNHPDAISSFQKKRIILREISSAIQNTNNLNDNNYLGLINEKVNQAKEAIFSEMQKDFKIEKLTDENKKLRNLLKKKSLRNEELKTKAVTISKIKNKLKKNYEKHKEQSEKDLNAVKEEVSLKKLAVTGLGAFAAQVPVGTNTLANLLGGFFEQSMPIPQNQEVQKETEIKTNETEPEMSELDKTIKFMNEQLQVYFANKEVKDCEEIWEIFLYVTQSLDNRKMILDLIKPSKKEGK